MKFKLGQKVKYKRISKKIEINMQYWETGDFEKYEEKELLRRESIELKKERTGLIVGRRNLVFRTIFTVKEDYYAEDGSPAHYVDITRQCKRFAYLVAYDMGHTNYVLEEYLTLIKYAFDEPCNINKRSKKC